MELLGFAFIVIFGTLGHFIFEWSGHRRWAGTFFAVNESTWEHIKLTIYPSFIWMVVELCVRGASWSIVVAQCAAMLVMMAAIPAIFYSYTAIAGRNFLIADIFCYVISVAAGMWVFSLVAPLSAGPALGIIAALVLAAIAVMYFRFSYHPPHCLLFRDPVSGHFGPQGHDCHSHFHQL